MYNFFMDEIALNSILKKALHPCVESIHCRLLKDQKDYRVWDVLLRKPSLRLIIKLAGPEAQYSSQFERAAAILRRVKEQTAIPMPDVLLADDSCHQWPWKVLIKTYIPGQEYAAIREQMTVTERSAAMAQIGDAVAQIHSIRFNSFGEVGADGQVKPAMNCIDALKAHAEKIIAHLDKDNRQERFLAALEPRLGLFANVRQACLCHEDLHAFNILFERSSGSWHLATILDFEKAWAGLPDSDLARMDLWSITDESFWQSYTARQPVDNGYPARRALLQMLWCLEVDWDTPAHRATTEAVWQELLNEPVSLMNAVERESKNIKNK